MKMLTATDVAQILGCSASTIRTLATKGQLQFRCLKIGAMWRFPEDDVMAYIRGSNAEPEVKVEEPEHTDTCAE